MLKIVIIERVGFEVYAGRCSCLPDEWLCDGIAPKPPMYFLIDKK